MDAAQITAIATGIAGVIGSITALVSLFIHVKNNQPNPPAK